jgi:hypothetical protein
MVNQFPVLGSWYSVSESLPRTAILKLKSPQERPSAMLSAMFRWTARFLLLVMFAPVFGPLAQARTGAHEAMHCVRQPAAAQPAMPCHGMGMAMAMPSQPESSEASFQAVDNCCLDHNCCGCVSTSEWAQPVSGLLSVLSLLIEPARPAQNAVLLSSNISGNDSARAPPLS